MSVDRQCASGMMAIATAAKQIVADKMDITVGGGLESISLVQNQNMNRFRAADGWITDNKPDLYMTMLETAEIVAERYSISREDQDQYAVQSQARTHEAQLAGRFDDEIVPVQVTQSIQGLRIVGVGVEGPMGIKQTPTFLQGMECNKVNHRAAARYTLSRCFRMVDRLQTS